MTFATADQHEQATATCTIPILEGWEGDTPVVGDVIFLIIIASQDVEITAPAGWHRDGPNGWYKVVEPKEPTHATFTADGDPETLKWWVHKIAVTPPFKAFDA